MKINYRILVTCFLSASVLLLTSCSKKDKSDPVPIVSASTGKIDVSIGGIAFEAQGTAQIASNQIIISGTVNAQALSIIITKAGVIGTYDVKGYSATGPVPAAEVNYTPDASANYSSTLSSTDSSVGTVTITEIDETNKTISGTFSSTVFLLDRVTSLNLTAGTFTKIPYTTKPANTLTAKINGISFSSDLTSAFVGSSIDIHAQADADTGNKFIQIDLNADIAVGSFKIGDASSTISTSETDFSKDGGVFSSKDGSLTITKHDIALKRIEGTFNFTTTSFGDGKDGPTVTEGAFAVTYQ